MRPCDARAPMRRLTTTRQNRQKIKTGETMTEITAEDDRSLALARDPGGQYRVRARMVRLLPLRHRRRAGVRRTVLSQERSGGRHAAGVPDLRRRLRGAAARRHSVRHHGRPLRAQTRPGGDAVDDRRRHHADRRAADLCPDRLLGAGAAGRRCASCRDWEPAPNMAAR